MKLRLPRRIARLGPRLLVLALPAALSIAASRAAEPPADLRSGFARPAAADTPPGSRSAADLGQALFFDPGLSASGTTSCASCHLPGLAWRDDRSRPPDRLGAPLPRRSPSLLNLAWAPLLTWDGRMDSLEQQALDPMLNPRIGGTTVPRLEQRGRELLSADPALATSFRAAFGTEEVTAARMSEAIAAFERGLVSPPAPFDAWIAGDEQALTPDAKAGFALFTGKARCAACHSGWRLTDDGFHDVGLPDQDLGRGARIPGEPSLQHAFKTPTLRNVAITGPYMHDGSLPTLEAVVTHYNSGFTRRSSLDPDVHPLDLSEAERAELVAFLQSLTSTEPKP